MPKHTAALVEANRIVCSCGLVCDAKWGRAAARVMGSKSDSFVAVKASTMFARHLRAVLSEGADDGE